MATGTAHRAALALPRAAHQRRHPAIKTRRRRDRAHNALRVLCVVGLCVVKVCGPQPWRLGATVTAHTVGINEPRKPRSNPGQPASTNSPAV